MSLMYRKEYAVLHIRTGEIHRGPYDTETEAQSWLDEWLLDGGKAEAFTIVTRDIMESSWIPLSLDKTLEEWEGSVV